MIIRVVNMGVVDMLGGTKVCRAVNMKNCSFLCWFVGLEEKILWEVTFEITPEL